MQKREIFRSISGMPIICAEGIPSGKSIYGGKTKTDRIDCRKIADLMRTNYFPLAYAYPQEIRGTRDLLRRRHRLSHMCAECYHHIQSLFHQQGLSVNPRDVKSVKTRRALIQHLDDTHVRSNAVTDLDYALYTSGYLLSQV